MGRKPHFFVGRPAGWFFDRIGRLRGSPYSIVPMTDADRLKALMEPILEAEGAELVDLEVAGSRGRPVVRAYVDTEEGVTLDECARFSRLLERELEESGAVPERYVLEVSSPGLERPLTKRRHFERFAGREVEVRLYAKRGGRKNFVGTLEGVRDGDGDGFEVVVLDPDTGERWTFAEDAIARARLHVRW
ncbi:MAG: ribosome maturation factor RimP [Gemmatimonadetes bacterium]|nr:ribosome maturation factor RimP [Gemmatimonadota bacterium]